MVISSDSLAMDDPYIESIGRLREMNICCTGSDLILFGRIRLLSFIEIQSSCRVSADRTALPRDMEWLGLDCVQSIVRIGWQTVLAGVKCTVASAGLLSRWVPPG